MKKIKKLLLLINNKFPWISPIFILFILIAIFYIIMICSDKPLNKNYIETKSEILDTVHTLSTRKDVLKHNEMVITTLQYWATSNVNSTISQEDGIGQLKSIYAAIIGILLGFVFRSNSKNGNGKIYLLILSIILAFYFLNIHLEDLKARSVMTKNSTNKALTWAIKQSPTDSIWFVLDTSHRDSLLDKMSKNKISRKIHRFFDPDISQKIFYILPFSIVYLFFFFGRFRKKKGD